MVRMIMTTRKMNSVSLCKNVWILLLVGVLESTVSISRAFVLIPRTFPPKIIPTTTTTTTTTTTGTPLSLSLDDSWEDVATFIRESASSVSSLDYSELIHKISNELQRQHIFSKEWFETLGTGILQLWNNVPWYQELAIVLLPGLVLITTILWEWSHPPVEYREGLEPYPRGNYDPVAARLYYQRHTKIVLMRMLEMLRLSNQFLFQIALDKYVRKNTENERSIRMQRAQELLQLITKLGPTAIKVGQALSVRPDLIDEEYAKTLATLQDQVPPFSDVAAKQILQSELGDSKYQELGFASSSSSAANKHVHKPIASASIGQVYKTKWGDTDVAVKVQRPNVLAEIALDLYIVREYVAPLYQKLQRSGTDLQALANEWGRGFIAELDYDREAEATARFSQAMKERNLNAVCAPRVIFHTPRVLITEWVDGKRIDDVTYNKEEIPRYCSIALNAYLCMLLELQSLHCDPHPGNLLRTKDGRLCILDFGMTLDIDPDLQYSLLEYVAHLTAQQYDKLPEDLVALGFLKREKLDFARRSGVLEPLKYFLKQANEGGGARGVRERIFDEYRAKYPGLTDDELRIEMRSEMKQRMSEIVERESVATGITIEVEELQKRNRDSFQIPEWFLYGSRAFLTLEGVSLQADPNYSLIKSCFPYVAKRLVSDDDERARNALKELIYGASDAVDVTRLTDLADGFSSYTTTTKTTNQQAPAHNGEIILTDGSVERVSRDRLRRAKMIDAEATITLTKDSADILLAPEGNLVQNLLVEEGALAASARLKDRVRDALVDGPQRFRESLPFGVGSFLPPLPFEQIIAPFVEKTEKEIRAQQLAEKIASLVPQSLDRPPSAIAAADDTSAITTVMSSLRELEPEQAALVLKELRENLPRYAPLMGQLGGKFVSTLLKTASKNIETTLIELELAGENPDEPFRTSMKGLSTAAQRGANLLVPDRSRDASGSAR